MGAIARSIANNITTSGVFTSSAITNSSVTGITELANAADGITLISSQTASSSASISFTSGITSTYKAYKFVFVNMHPSVTEHFTFNLSTDGGSNYNVIKTSTLFRAYNEESGTPTGLYYDTAGHLAQSSNYQYLEYGRTGIADSKDSVSGYMYLFNPSSTTYVKHFISCLNNRYNDTSIYSIQNFVAGYGNTSSAINAINFKFVAGNIDDGKIYMYGIK